ncbi:MAG TPA: hypothetical protein VEP90_14895 [Methylomirabilota bacterium]|nr:hypothetical protein [Methylomirabilota bacterium]
MQEVNYLPVQVWQYFLQHSSLVGFPIAGAFGYFLKGFVDEYREERRQEKKLLLEEKKEERKRIREAKHRLAEELILFCTEGQRSGYTKFPKDVDKVFLLSSELDSIDEYVACNFTLFFAAWGMYSLACRGMPEVQDVSKEMFKNATETRKNLLKIAGEWRK